MNPNAPEGGSGIARIIHIPNKPPHLYLARGETLESGEKTEEYLYYEIDGKVEHALLRVRPETTTCYLNTEKMTDEAWSLAIHRSGPGFVEDAIGEEFGIIAGPFSEAKPKVALSFKTSSENSSTSNWHPFEAGLLRNSGQGMLFYHWDAAEPPVKAYDASIFGLPAYFLYAREKEVLFELSSGGKVGVISWDLTHGVRQLLLSLKDITKGYGNFGTDGKDMVWTYGEGQPISEYNYPKNTLMTAPYTTDPETLLKTQRKLSADAAHMAPPGYVVGCGYASKTKVTADETEVYTSLIRLSDGAEWRLKPKNSKYPMPPIGITCEELWVQPPSPLRAEVAALRIDSLGPPQPASPLP